MFNDSTYLEIIQPIIAPHDDVSDILNFAALRASDNDDSALGDDMEMAGMDVDAEEADTVEKVLERHGGGETDHCNRKLISVPRQTYTMVHMSYLRFISLQVTKYQSCGSP